MVGTALSGPLQRAAGVDEPPGRRERRTCGILSAVGDVSYTRWYAVEGACKSLIKQRTDLSGQRWSPDGALNVLWVRARVKDGLHDQYWNARRSRIPEKLAA